jgi:tetratricopeptide (TPR) repeat protein
MAAGSKQQCLVWATVMSALLTASPKEAACQQPELQNAEAPPEARAHFERGREHFRAGRYREAIVELEAALELDPDSPTLMYNVAYANELLGELEQAIVYYRRYIDALPPSADDERAKIRVTLRRLEGHRAHVEAEPEPKPEPAAAAPQPDRSAAEAERPPPDGFGRADGWFWVSLGSGVAMLGGAAATGLMALDREDAVAEFVVGPDGSIGERQELQDEADRLALASDLLIGGGATLVAAAALLYFLREPDDEQPREPELTSAVFGSDGRDAMLIVRGSF